MRVALLQSRANSLDDFIRRCTDGKTDGKGRPKSRAIVLLGQRYIVIGGGIDGLQILGVDLVDGWFDSNAAGGEDLLLRLSSTTIEAKGSEAKSRTWDDEGRG